MAAKCRASEAANLLASALGTPGVNNHLEQRAEIGHDNDGYRK